ncbi:hypothetical protein [Ktedonospora formicarum]|uniref:Uncharacterized protein n=1 Tax=Ktedonospora formicarum TaxID=2778364 RepID=A0A8J3MYG5_9CHLR|nr:hypothetical protein [Ktedonospora formicarum]GHO50936.1 hypothetical protein KSX_90990 [Ktedonospora formicarum]
MDKDQQVDVFNIFHDGGIVQLQRKNTNDIELQVDILYLAEMVNPTYTHFIAILKSCGSFFFDTWERDNTSKRYDDVQELQTLLEDMDVLSAEYKDGVIEVCCWSDDEKIAGGLLSFSCEDIALFDEGGKEMSFVELEAIARQYWDDFSNRGRKAHENC